MCVEIGVGAMPCRTSLIANSASGVASATSTQQAMPTPPPKHAPWITAIVGLGSSFSVLLKRTVTTDAVWFSSGPWRDRRFSQLMSAPA